MRIKNIVIINILIITCWCNVSSANGLDSILNELDKTIDKREYYNEIKQAKIGEYHKLMLITKEKTQLYNIYGRLFDEYRSYNMDSAYYFAREKRKLALILNDREKILDSEMNYSDIYGLMGMFNESENILEAIDKNIIPEYLRAYYYHLHKNIYGLMKDYAVSDETKDCYTKIAGAYRDSLLNIKDKNSLEYAVVYSEKLIWLNKYDEAIKIISRWLNKISDDDHNEAFLAYSLAQVYKGKKDEDKVVYYLTRSAISDLKASVKEYVSLRELAGIMYKRGDIDRAWRYLKCSMEDATACNARLRTVQVSDMFPIIDDAYNAKKTAQRKQLLAALVGISILTLILVMFVLLLRKQMKKVSVARENLRDANEELNNLNNALKGVNSELNKVNEDLNESNNALKEASVIKDEYIGRYMDQCSSYLEKMETFRKTLYKLAKTTNMETLTKAIKAGCSLDNELKEFYTNFDDTFLRLFPSFVEEFNSLLAEDEKVYPKIEGQLNTELRIYALIRLGITDSVKIAQFLRYSVTTIYNYRTRIRNKAICERDDFERKVMNISQIIEPS